jgi:hypothetical protein
MSTNLPKFLELLQYSNELKKKNQLLCYEDPDKYKQLLKFSIVIEENLHLKAKSKYIELISLFLNNEMDAENFSFSFITRYDIINQMSRNLTNNFEENVNELSNLLIEKNSKSGEIGTQLMLMYDECDEFDVNSNSLITDEENLRNSARILLDKLKRT